MKHRRIAAVAASLSFIPLIAGAQTPVPAAGPVPATTTAADAGPAVMAVWVERRIYFPYMAFTSYYSCDGLRNKVRAILQEIGARPDFKVTARGCVNVSGPEQMPALDIVAALPREATPELMAELAKDASKRELAARVGKKGAATEATAQFPARTRRIDFEDSPIGLLQPGDCELVEQLRDRVFVPLGAKVVVDHMGCVPKQVSFGSIKLSIEVLEPVPPP
jgi:hypothetical protein